MKNIIYIILLVSHAFMYGQTCEIMYDAIETSNGIIISSEVSGNTYSIPDIPVMSKLDLNREEVWRVESNIPSGYYNLKYIKLYDFSDGYLYARLTIADSHANSAPNVKIWKVDAANGSIVWESQLFVSDGDSTAGLIDYNENHVLLYNPNRNNNGGTIYGFKVHLLDKINGNSTLIHESFTSLRGIVMTMDSKGNIYHNYLRRDNSNTNYIASIRKINGINFNNVIWEKDYIHLGNGVASLDRIDKLIITKKDELYAFSSGQNVDLFKVNGYNGDEIWSINNVGYENRITDYQFYENSLYLSLSHIYVGSSTTYFKIAKINLDTATLEWTSLENMTVVGTPSGSYSGDKEAIRSFDIDCDGNIFATGYYGDANYGPGAWGAMKIDGADGSKISDLTITIDETILDEYSVGLHSFVINGIPYFLGNIQYDSTDSTRGFIVTDTNLSTVQSLVDLCGILSTEEFVTSPSSVYPNPTKNILNIRSKSIIDNISIIDMNGRLLKSESFTNSQTEYQIKLKDLSQGIYFVKIQTDSGIETYKIIKE